MPKAYSFSITPALSLPLVNEAALARTEAAANLEIMLARSLAGMSSALPHDHPDTDLGHLCAAMDALRVLVDGMEEASSPFAGDDWLTDALVDRWQDAVGAVATAQPTTAAGLRLKAASIAMSIRTDARMDAGGAREGAMDKAREVALLGLLQDIAEAPEGDPQPAPHAPLPASEVAGAIPVDFAAMGLHYRAGDKVSFIIPRRGARGSARLGTAIAAYATPTGFLVVVREDDGTEHRRQADAVWSA